MRWTLRTRLLFILTLATFVLWAWVYWHRNHAHSADVVNETEVPSMNANSADGPGSSTIRKPFQEIAPH